MRRYHFVLALFYVSALYLWWQYCGSYFESIRIAPRLTKSTAALSDYVEEPTPAPSEAVASKAPVEPEQPAPDVQTSETETNLAEAAEKLARRQAAEEDRKARGVKLQEEVEPLHKAQEAACPPTRRPYHTILTGQGTIYNGWQSRIMYYHWKKMSKAGGPCTEMTGFTRLCASEKGLPDGLEKYIPSVFVKALTPEVLAKYGHFGVLNRPHSVVEFFKDPALVSRITEEWVYIAETDHVLMKPMPNLATDTEAAAHSFGYMHASPRHNSVVQMCWPEGDYSSLQPVGPSPLIIRKEKLQLVAQKWLDCSYTLRGSPEPARIIQDWVLEMWGYSIAAASLGIRHKVSTLQIEPNAYARTAEDFVERGGQYIFHYTYGIEYRLDGRPQGYNTIGEWSMDKRHYGGSYPPPNLDPPPSGANPSTFYLWRAWNDAITNEPEWPPTNAMGTIGWRREGATDAEIASSKLASYALGSEWTWAGIKSLTFNPAGKVKTPWGEGKWGLALKPKGLPQCEAPAECLYVDFSGAAHHLWFELPPASSEPKFHSVRVGDGEEVIGLRVK